MIRIISSLLVIALATAVSAEDQKVDTKPSGTWTKNNGIVKITLNFVKDGELNVILDNVILEGDKKGVTIQCSYKIEEGVIKAKVVSSEVMGGFDIGFKLEKFTFQFKFEVDKEIGSSAEFIDFQCSESDTSGIIKNIAEGTYIKKKIVK